MIFHQPDFVDFVIWSCLGKKMTSELLKKNTILTTWIDIKMKSRTKKNYRNPRTGYPIGRDPWKNAPNWAWSPELLTIGPKPSSTSPHSSTSGRALELGTVRKSYGRTQQRGTCGINIHEQPASTICCTPLKINMEPKEWNFEKWCVSFSNRLVYFQVPPALSFRGKPPKKNLPPKRKNTKHPPRGYHRIFPGSSTYRTIESTSGVNLSYPPLGWEVVLAANGANGLVIQR